MQSMQKRDFNEIQKVISTKVGPYFFATSIIFILFKN